MSQNRTMSRRGAIIFDRPAAREAPFRRHCRISLLGLAGGAAALYVTACGQAEQPPEPVATTGGAVVLELIAELPAATVAEEAAAIELGHASARPHLAAGWGADEEDADGTYVWGLGSGAGLSFFAVAPAAVTLGLHCKPLIFEGAPEQTMSVAVNGEQLGEISMGRKLERYQIEVPAAAVAGGLNRVDLHFGYHRRPRDVIAGATDERDLAVRCYRIELEGLGADGSPRVAGGTGDDPAGNRIELPVGTAVTFYFDHASGTELMLAGLEAWGPRADLSLIVRCRSAAASQSLEQLVDPGGARLPVRVPLATEGPAVDRLELAAVAEKRGLRGGWLRKKLRLESEAGGLSLLLPSIRERGTADGVTPTDGDSPPDRRPSPEAPRAATGRPNVIIYLIDTLRADHLGAYGYDRPTSPNIDRFADDGVLFGNAQAQSSWTRPSVVSLLTGLRPRRHGVNRRQDALSGSVDTLAELLSREGYDTAGFVTNGNAGPDFGLDQGFEEFRYLRESADTRERHRLSDHLNGWLFHWLENRGQDQRPFFLYAHATDPHVPYTPVEPFRRRFAPEADPEIGLLDNVRAVIQGRRAPTERTRQDLIDLYDAEIAFNDHHFGLLIERLKQLGLYQSSLIVLVSDHGEEFLDHDGWEHGVTLFDDQLHVPLIVKFPQNDKFPRKGTEAGTRADATVSQVDVMPTVLDLLGIALPAGLDGVSLLDEPDRASFGHLSIQNRTMRSITRKSWKLILDDSRYPRGLPLQLFSLATDRREIVELAAERPFERELLLQLMRRWELDLARRAGSEGELAEIPDELRRQLEALGYL